MRELGYVPKIPVDGKNLGDAEIRKIWMEEKNMIVFSYIDLNNPLVLVDIFVNEPQPFEDTNKSVVWATDCEYYGARQGR